MSVENRARCIPDAPAKLRYLRQAARLRSKHARWTAVFCITLGVISLSPPARPVSLPVISAPKPLASLTPPKIFLVEHSSETDLYSNGLIIRSAYQNISLPRLYRTYDRTTLQASAPKSIPAGIVFHSTESLLLPLEENARHAITRTREDLLAHIRTGRLYNFLIDRFGQVFRIIPEDQTAFHAGHSVWADASTVFLNLNESFLGVAFETHAGEDATPAQATSARLLTAMLRAAYSIPDGNCVTHAQVSVNPDNLRIGYHTDWGSRFPFHAVGLNLGYSAPIAALEVFGFSYDESLLSSIGGHPWDGLIAAERQILIDAGARGITGPNYRKILQQHYQALRRHL